MIGKEASIIPNMQPGGLLYLTGITGNAIYKAPRLQQSVAQIFDKAFASKYMPTEHPTADATRYINRNRVTKAFDIVL